MSLLTLIWVSLQEGLENLKIAFHYYRSWRFTLRDFALLFLYFVKSPYAISRRYWSAKKSNTGGDTYGETPISVLAQIFKRAQVSSSDTFYDLGCGTARTTFWAAEIIKCNSIGIEILPDFMNRAAFLNYCIPCKNIQLYCQDFLEIDYGLASVVYLNGTTLSDEAISSLADALLTLTPGARLITTSYPITHYAQDGAFEIIDSISVRFFWGTTDVYIQERQSYQPASSSRSSFLN